MSASWAIRDIEFTPLMYGRTRFNVRSEEIGDCRPASDIVRSGTWCARTGGGGGLVGKSFRLIVFESSGSVSESGSSQSRRIVTNGDHALSIVVQIL